MPSPSVSAQQFFSRPNVVDEPEVDIDTPLPGSANTWGPKRYSAWSSKRMGLTSHSKETMGSTLNFDNED